ncbi:hypothetical protein E2C06_34945 [Dankookia rubra]|uniref:Uncharacterized protein n=1 Tax=Dankookia rubra TaxID=1442381 RepID=A0A4R5Q6W5_9PROT|nr:hypothetical protein [Dankookia rubra]TDH57991.1 hypothetical protein E2C06_34945 [Dankookia rubra]
MPGALKEKDATKLARLCGLLGSEHDGERANAAAFATRTLKAAGWTWDDLVGFAVRGSEAKAPPALPRRGLSPQGQLRWLEANSEWCSAWEAEFARSVAGQRHPLTARQIAKLAEVFGRVMARRGDTWAG